MNAQSLLRVCAFVSFLVYISSFASANTEFVRCAFDIGSGETKLVIARVKRTEQGVAVNKLAAESTPVVIKKAVVDGVLPEHAKTELIKQLMNYKKNVKTLVQLNFQGLQLRGFVQLLLMANNR